LAGGGLGPATDTVARWADADIFVGVGDVTGDAKNDVVARSTTTHELRVYPGRGDGTFGTSRVAIDDASVSKRSRACAFVAAFRKIKMVSRLRGNDATRRASRGRFRPTMACAALRLLPRVATRMPSCAPHRS